jgi:lysophospholipase L1-like esterase
MGGSAGGTGFVHPAPWRVMPLGDSITETTCYPHLLWKKLRDNGHTNFDFVGTKKNNQACGVPDADQDCEGHSGYKVTDLVNNGPNATELPQWCLTDKAEIVLMHFGTNDVWNNIEPNKIISAFSSVMDALRAVNPKVIVFVAQIIAMTPSNCSECNSRVQALNALIPNWANSKSTASSPIYIVDLFTGFTPATDTPDGVHANPTGAQKMADGWYKAIVARNLF